MTADENPPLDGAADESSWYFKNVKEEGPLPNPVGHTFPLLTHDPSGYWRLIGTGFYVSDDGLFITARHNICDVIEDGRQVAPLVILHFHSSRGLFGASEVIFRPIAQCWLSSGADIAFGVAAATTNTQSGDVLRNSCWELSWATPAVGTPVGTYAFPRHKFSDDKKEAVQFHPQLYPGRILKVDDYRDSVMIPFPYLCVDCRIHGAASGGPIVVNGGKVIGVNCTEFKTNESPGPGYGVQIQCLRDAFIDDIVLLDEGLPRRVTFDELVSANCIPVDDFVGQPACPLPRGLLVRLDQIPVTAPHPRINLTQSY
jgi:Trypsin-like peptidase domain